MAQQKPGVLSSDNRQHLPLSGGDTINVGAIPLSADSGNMIQARADGIYYGTVAPADISQLYISTTLGSDDNPGTRERPLQTIERALAIINERNAPGSYAIRLRAGEVFTPATRTYFGEGQWAFRFSYYDDPLFGDILARNGYYPEADARLNRPTVNINTVVEDRDNNIIGWTGLYVNADSTITFQGINVTFSQSGAGAITGGGWCWYVSELQFSGCDVTLASDHEGIGSARSIITRQCNFTLIGNTQFFISDYAPGWMDTMWVGEGVTNKDPYGEGPDVVGRPYNMRSVVTPANGMALAAFDATTKTLFGWDANWDIFANG